MKSAVKNFFMIGLALPLTSFSSLTGGARCPASVAPLEVDTPPAYYCGAYRTNQLPEEARVAYQRALDLEKSQVGDQAMAVSVDGLALLGSRFEVESFNTILGEIPPKGWQKTVRGCATVVCALSKLFGSVESAQRALVVYYYSGYVISLDQSAHRVSPERVFSVDEIREIDLALRFLPSHFYRLPNMRDFVTADPKQGASATAEMAIYKGSEFRPGRILIRESMNYVVFFHEFGHQVDFMNSSPHSSNRQADLLSTQRAFLDCCWLEGRHEFMQKNGNARRNPVEDFAEMFKTYIMWPQVLSQTSPDSYRYFKTTVFNGKEYPVTRNNCDPINRFPNLPF